MSEESYRGGVPIANRIKENVEGQTKSQRTKPESCGKEEPHGGKKLSHLRFWQWLERWRQTRGGEGMWGEFAGGEVQVERGGVRGGGGRGLYNESGSICNW